MFSLQRRQIIALSFFFWTIYAILDSAGSIALVVSGGEKPFLPHVLLWNFANAYVWVLYTPLIHALTVRFGFTRKSWKTSLFVHLLASLPMAMIAAWLLIHMNMLFGWDDKSSPFGMRLLSLGLEDLPRYFVTLGLIQVVVYYGVLREREMQSSRLEAKLAQAQLEILRSQLHPHFLFNTLNSIATLTQTDPSTAERMTLQLATLLRVSLDSAASQEVPLERELEILRNYLAIQQTRFRDRLTVNLKVEDGLLRVPVPSMILQPLVENAIQHGIAKSAAPGRIDITAARQNGSVRIEISDNGTGLTNNVGERRDGVGLRNTRSRLKQLYGEHSDLILESDAGKGCRVTLMIPLAPHS